MTLHRLKPVPPCRQSGITLIEVVIAITLLSMLSVGMLATIRMGFDALHHTNARLMENRRVAGAQRVLEEELEGMTPVVAPCGAGAQSPNVAFFQGEPQSMRLVSIFSLQQAWRGQPKILELFVIPGEQGGVRLVVNELPYTGPVSAGHLCTGVSPDPTTGQAIAHFAATGAGPKSFVLADKLAYCKFNYLWRSNIPSQPLPTWRSAGGGAGWPIAVRVEMAPLDPDPSRLQPITVTAAIHLHLSPEIPYGDY